MSWAIQCFDHNYMFEFSMSTVGGALGENLVISLLSQPNSPSTPSVLGS